MKKTIFLIAFLSVLSPIIKAQWVQQYSGNPSILFTTNFVDINNGFAAGANETFLATTNGGLEWTVLHQGGSDDTYGDMFFKDSQTGWTVLGGWTPNRHGSILKTTNGGISWITQFYIDGFLFISVFFIDDQKGWAVGTNGIIFNTTNGGSTWNFQYQLYTGEWLYDVYFIDQNTGWAVGNLGNKILKTNNGGNSWQWIWLPTTDFLLDIEFIDQNNGITVGDNGRILTSKDGGDSWEIAQSGTSSLFRDVEYNSSGEAWVVGYEGVILHSTNDGNTWNADASGTVNDLFSVSFINGSGGWVCGDDQLILHRGNSSIEPITVVSPNGGEIWVEGTQKDLTWSSSNIEAVKIELSLNNGASWSTIIDSTLSTGIFLWTVPNTFSDSCLVKISDYQNPDTLDISDGMFAIRSQASLSTVTVISPNGGESWVAGTQQNITWTSEFVENVKIELSLNNGASWNSIVDSTTSTGIYSWLVNAPQSSIQSRIRISNILDQEVYDVSDQVFSIQVPVSVANQLSNIPKEYKLTQNYPNPFNPSTTISFDLPVNSNIVLKVFNLLGEQVAKLADGEYLAGSHQVIFDASNLSSGLYIYRIQAKGDDGNVYIDNKKMIVMK